MGFSNVTGKSRPKRPGCETKSERNKRKARQNDQETVEELRVVKAKRCGAKGGERAPEQLTKKKSQWEKKMAALLKTNDAIKALDARRAAPERVAVAEQGRRGVDGVADLGPMPGGYKVKEGDCLYGIAVRHGVDPGIVERMNPELAARANNIEVGEYVRLP